MNRRYAITSSVKTDCNCPCRWRYFSSLFPFSFTFIISLLYWWRGENEVMLSGVFLECLNERRLSFIQNNLFLETSTHRNYFLSRKYTKYYCFWLLQSCKTTPLNHSYKLCEDCLEKITTATVYYHVASLRLIYTCIYAWGGEKGRGWGWNCPCTKCIESLLTETIFGDNELWIQSIVFVVVVVVVVFYITSLWFLEFGFSAQAVHSQGLAVIPWKKDH